MKLSIIIPCYNEKSSIEDLVKNCLENINDETEILLVDNGSSDNTFKVLSSLNLPKNIIPLRVEKNKGYGNGILFGLNQSKGEIVSWTHADLQTDISDVTRGYKSYKDELINKSSIVKGTRKKRNLFDFFLLFQWVYIHQ
tara:strand:- start:9 stop:428 length:420 start_codon:yes stop_codon:yes gene_type:complete